MMSLFVRVRQCLFATLLGTSLFSHPATAETIRVINGQSSYPEGPLWDAGMLFYAEMGNDRIMRWDGQANTEFWHAEHCGPTTIAKSMAGGYYIFCHIGNRIYEVSAAGQPIRQITADQAGERIGNPNESVRDSVGGIYFTSSGTFSPFAPSTGRVFYITPNGVIRKVADGIRYANGLALTPNQTQLVVGAHLDRQLLVYAVTSVGHLGPAKPFLNLNPTMDADKKAPWYVGPDGLVFDKTGNLYVCEYGGGRVLVFDAALKLRKAIRIESPYVNASTFGTSEQILFVGAADSNSSANLPGKVYEITDPLN